MMQFPQSADLNLRVVRQVVRYVGDYYGRGELELIAKASGLTLADLDGTTRWASLEQIESVLLGARQLMPDDATFSQACAYEIDEPRGAIRLWLGAFSPTMAYEIGCKNIHHLLTRISRFEIETIRRGEIRLRYRSTRPESRLLCFTRHASIAGVPKMWGLPAAHLTEETCIAHGDDCCSYHVRYYEARRWIPAALGLALGSAAVAALHAMGQTPSWAWVLVAGVAGILYDQRTAHVTNRHTQEGINAAYLQIARDDAHARRELFELTQRQKTWGHLMEDEVVDKVDRLKQLVAEVEQLHPNPVVQLKRASASPDNPLSAIRSGLEQLRGISPSEAGPTVDRLSQTVVVLDRKLRTIARLASAPGNIVSLCSRTVAVAPLADELRNRLQALVRGKDVRVSVFSVRDAPESITIDIVLFNRIIDNLLLNAAEFTEHGSIIVEVAGTPDFLTIKISDTGGTLREDEVGKIFRPMQRGPGGYSYGAGLSVVVQLLASVGGKLDVMTHNGKGTTFWAHFPLNKERAAIAVGGGEAESDETAESESSTAELSDGTHQAVTIRKFEGG
jgi:signal transduction histidine kinase